MKPTAQNLLDYLNQMTTEQLNMPVLIVDEENYECWSMDNFTVFLAEDLGHDQQLTISFNCSNFDNGSL